jgi:hypothetical protein
MIAYTAGYGQLHMPYSYIMYFFYKITTEFNHTGM